MAKHKNYHGVTINDITFISKVEVGKGKPTRWIVRCHCGNCFESNQSNIVSGNTLSCGCVHGTHKATNTPLYQTWKNMKARCHNPNLPNFHRYGGRGIKVCDEWKNDFTTFQKWAEESGYTHGNGLSLDRRNNDGDYTSENCRWVDRTIQSRNQNPSYRNKSGVRGVIWSDKDKVWYAKITTNKVVTRLGSYKDVNSAIIARRNAEIEQWGYTKITEDNFHSNKKL